MMSKTLSNRIEDIKTKISIAQFSQTKFREELNNIVENLKNSIDSMSIEEQAILFNDFPMLKEIDYNSIKNLSYDELMEFNKNLKYNLSVVVSELERKLC